MFLAFAHVLLDQHPSSFHTSVANAVVFSRFVARVAFFLLKRSDFSACIGAHRGRILTNAKHDCAGWPETGQADLLCPSTTQASASPVKIGASAPARRHTCYFPARGKRRRARESRQFTHKILLPLFTLNPGDSGQTLPLWDQWVQAGRFVPCQRHLG